MASRRAGAKPRKDVVLVQLAMALLRGQSLTYAKLEDQYGLPRRSAERYLNDLEQAGLAVVRTVGAGRRVTLMLRRPKGGATEVLDVADDDARSLALLSVGAALLPQNLGIREALESTVKAALRVRGMRATATLKQWEELVLVLENNAKDHRGASQRFGEMMDAAVRGEVVTVGYRSPKRGSTEERFWPAGFGLYRGGLYVLAVPIGDDGTRASWLAFERFVGAMLRTARPVLPAGVRSRALREAKERWGPSPAPKGDATVVVTLQFSSTAAPYVRARPWHPGLELATEPDGSLRAGIRLKGETAQLESWIKSWGQEAQVLHPRWLAERIADDLFAAALAHRRAHEG